MKKGKIISPISCEKEPMATIYRNIERYALQNDIPFPTAVRKFLIAGNAGMKRLLKAEDKSEKN